MIHFTVGNILESGSDALVNTVNTQGIMGKGIALQFKKHFPNNYQYYREICNRKEFKIGDIIFFQEGNLISKRRWIINFPTKTSWRKPSEYIYIEKGLDTLIRELRNYPDITSISFPPLGSGNGGLDWSLVKEIMKDRLKDLNIDITIYEPNKQIIQKMKSERVKLTPARAMLLYMLFQLVKNGELVSEFSSEKICYFLQRFGAGKDFNLNYSPNFYGPYSGLVRRVLYALNGSYIMGYSGMDKKPFESLSLVADSESEVLEYINNDIRLKEIVTKTDSFLTGFYSNFGLEMLSTIDYISNYLNTFEIEEIKKQLGQWSERKKTLFANSKFVDISLVHLQSANFN